MDSIEPGGPTIVLVPRETERAGPIAAVLLLLMAVGTSFALGRIAPQKIAADLGAKAVAALAACWLATYIDRGVYERFAERGGAPRLLAGVVLPVIAGAVGLAAGVGCLRLAPALGDRGTLGLTFLVGGLWLMAASLGSLVVLGKESPRRTLRARSARALLTVFVLSVLVSLSAARWGPWLLSKLLDRAPQLLDVWSDVRALALVPAGSSGLWVSAALLLVALPAALSTCGKLMDGAAERVAALQAASEEVVEGRLDVRVDEGGTRELARLSRSYNDMLDSFTRARRIEQAFGPRTEATLGRLKARCPDGRAPPALRTATVMFAEIRDLSSVLQFASPTQAVRLLAGYFDRVIATLDRHEGFLERMAADSMIAVFNAPLDQDDHMIRATRCAIELQTELTTFLRSDEAAGVGKFTVAIGVASGPIVTGTTDGASCRYVLAGETFDLAARLAALTPSGQVWVNQRNAETLPMYIPSMMLPAVTLRGSSHPVAPYRVWPPP